MSISLQQKEGWIWFDGEFVPWAEAKVHVLTHTLHYGTGVFEGVRAYQTDQGVAIFRLHDHTARLFNSASVLGMSLPFDQQQINDAQKEVIRRNKLDSAYLRPMAFYGAEGLGLRSDVLKVHCIVAAWEWGTYLGKENMENGIRIKTSSYSRYHPYAEMSSAKINGYYVNSMLALREALAAGCEEAMMLDSNGCIAEGSGENIFFVKDGEITTPAPGAILDGITRKTIIELATSQGIKVTEKAISVSEAMQADEIFLTGTAAEVTPVKELDGKAVGSGTRGPVTEKLQNLFFDLVHGRDPAHTDWNILV